MDESSAIQMSSCSSPDVSEIWKLAKFFIQLSYILPSVLIYLKFLHSVVKEKSIYSDAFFTLYIVDGISSIFTISIEFFALRMLNYVTPYCELVLSYFKEPTYVLTPLYYIFMFFQFMKSLSILSLCANRFTSVIWPVKHSYIWKTYIHRIIITQVLTAAFSSLPIITGPVIFIIYQNSIIINYVHTIPYFRTSTFRLIIMLPSVIFIIISNIIIISKLSKLSSNVRKVERSMTLSTIFISIGFILILIFSIVIVITPATFPSNHPNIVDAFLIFSQIANDVYMISGPIVLLILNKNIRKSIFYWQREPKRTGPITRVQTLTD